MGIPAFAAWVAVALLVVVHVVTPFLRFLEGSPRSVWLSIAGGVSVAYVFVHLLPELAAGEEQIGRATRDTAFAEHHVYLIALLGLATFYGLDRMAKTSRSQRQGAPVRGGRGAESAAQAGTSPAVFWIHMGSFAVYNALIGYLLLHREVMTLGALAFFTFAMALHFVVTDYGLNEDHKAPYRRIGRWVLVAAVAAGFLVGTASEISKAAIAVLTAFLAGGVILNVLKGGAERAAEPLLGVRCRHGGLRSPVADTVADRKHLTFPKTRSDARMRVGHEEADMPAPQSFFPTLLTLAALAALAGATKAGAAELSNLDAGLPTAIDDAFAVAPGRLELQGAARYDRIHGRDAVQLLPRVQLGVIEGLQVNLALPYTVGSGRRYDPGSAGGGLLYNLNHERGWLPAFAVAVDYSTPIGPERRSAEIGLTGIATKTITPAVDRRLYLNVAWLRALNPDEEERRDRYRVIAGYSQLVAPNIVAVLDYSRESQERRQRDANIVEAGLRYQFTDAVTLGAGAGFGVGRDSPRFRAIASIQVGFGGR